jgi:FlaA1/EpsC-like NDP-sugar epimerase
LLVSGITLSILKFLALIATKTTFGEMSRARSWFSVEQVDPRFWHLRTADLEEQVPARIRALAREMEKVMAKTAIVTGASRGIGRSIAERLASDGFAVAVNFAGKAYEADKVVDEIRQADGEALAIKADVSNPEDVKQLFAKSIEAFGRVDVVVNIPHCKTRRRNV